MHELTTPLQDLSFLKAGDEVLLRCDLYCP